MKSNPVKVSGKLFRYDFDRSVVEYIIKFVPAMIEELADAQRRLVAMHDQIRLLVWLGKEEN